MEFNGITLVTGAAGFMVSHLVEFLVRNGIRVRASSRPREDTSFFNRLGVEFIPADLTKPETLPRLFEGNVDRVFHLGAICNFSTPYESLYPTNVTGVKLITELALKNRVKRYIHVGSTSVYGYFQGTPFKEDSPKNPQDAYGKSKRDGEDVVRARIKEGLQAIITRPCTVYGPGCNDGAGKVFSRPLKLKAIPGSGRQLLSNIRAEEVAAAITYLSLNDAAVGQAFNLAEDTHPTLEEAIIASSEAFGSRPPKLHLPLWLVKAGARLDEAVSVRKGRIPDLERDAVKYLYADYVVDNSRLKSLGYRLFYPDFYKSMRQMGEWYRGKRKESIPYQ